MALTHETIEEGLRRLYRAVREDAALHAEFTASSEVFFGADGVPEEPLAAALGARRHLEWFLLERPSDVVGGVPAEALMEELAGFDAAPEVFLNSLAGVFEVTGVQAEEGAWLKDLFGMGEYPVHEPDGASDLAPGDLVVGRIFPAGDALFRLSPASRSFRDTRLLAALRKDAQRLREGRRGTLRVPQHELEHMFFAPSGEHASGPSAADAREAARGVLLEAGLEPAFTDRLLDELAQAAAEGRADAVTEALSLLAFETDVDLEAARASLVVLWGALCRKASAAAGGRSGEADEGAPPEAVREALARFDEGRDGGGSLEELFRALEEDLGLEPSAEREDPEPLPDFPEVVSAMIEEFLWETSREEGPEAAARHEPLRLFGRFASSIGVFENLSTRHVLDFAGRWVLDESAVHTGEEARALMLSMTAFCRWCEEQQDLALWSDFSATLDGLARSLPRLVELRRRHLDDGVTGGKVYTFARGQDGGPLLVDRAGDAHEVHLAEGLDGLLRDGDLLHALIGEGGEVEVGACYPPELADLVS